MSLRKYKQATEKLWYWYQDNKSNLELVNTNINNWNSAFGWGNHAAAGYLTDAPSDGSQYARIDGAWALVAGGAEVNDLSVSVTWVNVPDANITQSSVTQHEAALAIAWGQLTGTPTTLAGYGITDFDTEISNNASVVANTAKVTFPGFTSLLTDYSFTDNSSNWDTAHGWGDHSAAGYLQGIETANNLFGGSTAGENIVTEGGSTAFGIAAMQNSNAINNSAFGYEAMQENTGLRSNAFGLWAGKRNTGQDSNFFGQESGQFNRGTRVTGFGTETLQSNQGDDVIGIGENSAIFNEGDKNTGIGNLTLAFQANVSGLKSFVALDVTAASNRISITSHGFGSNGTYVNLLYEGVTGGITNNKIYPFQIIDANTIELQEDSTLDLDGTEVGDLTPQTVYTNVTVIGYNAQPTASNQVVLGDTNVTSVLTSGSITADSFIKDGGTASEFLKADGTVDSTVYGTGNVTKVGTPANNQVTIWTGDGTADGATNFGWNNATSYMTLLQSSGFITIDFNTNNALVYTAAGGGLAYDGDFTADTLIKTGGTSAQFLKADGSVDANTYSQTSHTHTLDDITDYDDKFGMTLENPTASEDISFMATDRAITITKIIVRLVGNTSPSVTWTIRHGTDRSAAGAEVVTSGTTTTTTTTGQVITSFNDATIVADSAIWLETTAQSGTVTELSITVYYTID